jgi:hypothetical protein
MTAMNKQSEPPLPPPAPPRRGFGAYVAAMMMILACLHLAGVLTILMFSETLLNNYAAMGVALPGLTKVVLAVGEFVRPLWYVVVPVAAIGMVWLAAWPLRSKSTTARVTAHVLFWLSAGLVLLIGAAVLLPYAALLQNLTR